MTNDIFGRRMLIRLGRLNMSNTELARLLNCPKESISLYINGKTIPKIDRACDIANILGVSLDWLCGLSNVEQVDDPNIEIGKNIQDFADKCAELRNILSIIEEQAREATKDIDI